LHTFELLNFFIKIEMKISARPHTGPPVRATGHTMFFAKGVLKAVTASHKKETPD
jgi:hypothetical protein